MKRILPDTNALMAMIEFKFDLFTELQRVCDFPYKIYVLESVLEELDTLQRSPKGKERRAAKLILAILRTKKIPAISGKGYADTILQQHSQQGDLVLTQDIALKKRLTCPYLTIRQKKRIVIVT